MPHYRGVIQCKWRLRTAASRAEAAAGEGRLRRKAEKVHPDACFRRDATGVSSFYKVKGQSYERHVSDTCLHKHKISIILD
jgi:hypothetical protein